MTVAAVRYDVRTRRTAALALVGVTAVWGSTFGLSKHLLDRLPVADYLGLRYLVAATVLLVVAPRLLRGLSGHTVRVGIGLGVLYAGAQLLQFHGLSHTAPTPVSRTPMVASWTNVSAKASPGRAQRPSARMCTA